jgi:hypothetical protein
MYKIASIALTAALGVAGIAHTQSAEAHPYIGVGVAYPGAVVVEPARLVPAYYGPYYGPYYYHGRYWHHGYDRYRYEHFRHWDRR